MKTAQNTFGVIFRPQNSALFHKILYIAPKDMMRCFFSSKTLEFSDLFVSNSYQSACLLLREFLLLVLNPESSNDKRKSQYWIAKDTQLYWSTILAKDTGVVEYYTCKQMSVLNSKQKAL